MSMMVNPFRFGGGAEPLSLTWWNTYGGNVTSFSLASQPIGTAGADRWVILGITSNHNTARSISSVTIGGVSASLMYASPNPLSVSGNRTEFWKANVPTGTTATVAVTFSARSYDGAFGLWASYQEPLLFDSAEDLTISGASFSLTIDVPEGGAVVAMCNNNAGGSTVSSLTGVTQDFLSTTFRIVGGSDDLLSAETGRTVAVTWNAGSPIADFDGLSAISVGF